jgi:anti-sigma regulatory factor (Ser/Thr protein kinase)
MIVHQQISVGITDRSSIGEARRISSQMAERAGMQGVEGERVPLIVTELATNALLHARGGEILIRILPDELRQGLEIIALDRGPGIADIPHCMVDGNSGSGTRGCGLGAVRRLSTEFDIYSSLPIGTVVMSRVHRTKPQDHKAKPSFSAISIPVAGEIECGDAWHLRQADGKLAVIVVDGLGHGPFAAAAAAEALDVFSNTWFETPAKYLEAAHSALNTGRGAAIAVAQVDLRARRLHYSGIGNIAGNIVGIDFGKVRPLLSLNGIVGSGTHKLQQFDYQWEDNDLLIMHSDGLGGRWKLGDYPGLPWADTGIIAGVLYRDSRRHRDDATVLVARLKAY